MKMTVIIVRDKFHVASDILTDIYRAEMTPPSSKIEHDSPPVQVEICSAAEWDLIILGNNLQPVNMFTG